VCASCDYSRTPISQNKYMKTQEQFITDHLLKHGTISRNFCLRKYITRLSEYIHRLRKAGWIIDGGYVKTRNGEDYRYTLLKVYIKN